jgi:hypothetical protein
MRDTNARKLASSDKSSVNFIATMSKKRQANAEKIVEKCWV